MGVSSVLGPASSAFASGEKLTLRLREAAAGSLGVVEAFCDGWDVSRFLGAGDGWRKLPGQWKLVVES